MHLVPIIVVACITPPQFAHHEVVTISITIPMHAIRLQSAEQMVLLRIIEAEM
jgi:hypothetical protein